MVDAIIKEISFAEINSDQATHTIYFGGGTPSLLSSDQIEKLLNAIHNNFSVSSGAEITFEANPDNINLHTLHNWKALGVNRLSVGIQSFAEEELKWMNRAHNAEQSYQCLKDIEAAGFTNYSVDLIYGSPLLSDENLVKNAQVLLSANVPHISCYALTVEPKTGLHKMIREKQTPDVDSARQSDQFIILMNLLRDNGYEHYEISNFAKQGYRSKHNSSYWKGLPYYGFGPSAHSFNGKNTRKWNIANNALYIQSLEQNTIPSSEEILTETQQFNEYIMISLRTIEGIDLSFVKRNWAFAVDQLISGSQQYIANKLMEQKGEHMLLTDQGKLYADGIAADLFYWEPLADKTN